MNTERPATIVVVDDNLATQYATTHILEAAGFRVLRVSTGREALALAEQQPDLYLLDVNLPDMHGFQVCERLRQHPHMGNTPIIHISASFTTGADQVQGLDVGADGYLIHPIEPPVLIATVRAFLRARRAETKLRESEARFRKIADAAPAMLWVARPDQHWTFLSGAWQEFTGQSADDGLGMGWTEVIHPDDREGVLNALRAAAEAGEPIAADCRLRGHDGVYRWAVNAARPLFGPTGGLEGYVGSLIDIHDRKMIEQALLDSEAKFRTLADNIAQFAWMADPTGWVFWYNQRWFTYTGTTLLHMEGWGWKSVCHPEHLERVLEKYRRHMHSGKTWEDVFPIRGKDGEYRWFLSRAVPIRNDSGEIIRWFGTNTDITERKRAEEERAAILDSERAARRELDRVSRIKDEFLGTLSHELRTPLNAILGWTFLLRKESSPETVAQGIAVIERNARIQTQLISDLLDMSRVISGKLRLDVQPVRLCRVVEAALDSVRHAAEAKGVRVAWVNEAQDETVHGDPSRLQQVVWNLLSNAIKFTPGEGTVRVAVAQLNGHVEITVSDTGKGIKPDFLSRIFDRFQQADNSAAREHGGLGIGLSLVKQIVELHGGRVSAESAGEGQGATFVVTLPIAAAGPQPNKLDSVHPRIAPLIPRVMGEPPALDHLSILLVDDEPDALDTISRLLVECNANVTAVESAQEGLAAVRRRNFDLIISDIGMPIFDGYEFMRRVREHAYEGPALALTAFAREEDCARALEAGFQAHVAKPVEPWELLSTVAALGGSRSGHGPAHNSAAPEE